MKALVLENEFINEDDGITTLINSFKDKGYEVTIIERAYQEDKGKLVEAIMDTDVLLFQTTWLREHEIEPFGALLAMAKPLEVYCLSLSSHSIAYHLEKIFKLETLAKISKHKLFKVTNYYADDNWCKEINLKRYKEQFDEEERIRVETNNGLRKTGFKIRIKEVQANGPQFSNLKEGDIVDELDCSAIDPNPARGVWVMGNGEPVKLLNSDGYSEFEYTELDSKCFAIAHEFFTRGNRKDQRKLITLFAQYINGYLNREIDSGKVNLWIYCDEICDLVGVERRGNRHFFEKTLKTYLDKHKFFCEYDRTDRIFQVDLKSLAG